MKIIAAILFMTCAAFLASCNVRMEPAEQERQLGQMLGVWRARDFPDSIVYIRKDLIAILSDDGKGNLRCKRIWSEPFNFAPEKSWFANSADVLGRPRLTRLHYEAQRYSGLAAMNTGEGMWLDTLVDKGAWLDDQLLMMISINKADLPDSLAKLPAAAQPGEHNLVFIGGILLKKEDALVANVTEACKKWYDLQRAGSKIDRWSEAPKL